MSIEAPLSERATSRFGSLARALIGLWTLERYSEIDGRQVERTPFGPSPAGFLIYTVDGFVSVQLMSPGRPLLGHGAWERSSGEAYEAITTGYIAYCGRYSVNEAEAKVIHLPTVALIPNLIDLPQQRSIQLAEDRLVLSMTHSRPAGDTVLTQLVWRRTHGVS